MTRLPTLPCLLASLPAETSTPIQPGSQLRAGHPAAGTRCAPILPALTLPPTRALALHPTPSHCGCLAAEGEQLRQASHGCGCTRGSVAGARDTKLVCTGIVHGNSARE
ncbi:hypothetical protein HaLaN_29241 [Haematococcus lacustris]|uniref:Uncharacterized protein n=1 Tax=Haematococcus lacustris TaxID=44745 RepID=A0A6A0ADP2_HAELA|nr:hypothetical protein HaLaN_29241 [Haematococcus lacustris]